ncbi:MAG: YicC family protein [Paludibacteraceae bacterium]|nr:YicC family protein [Paludibacteraceae bacterium]MBO7637045.1 YicC family protein [Paludibacteraceae bacterium]MBR5972875.1 YicC family protein [Paludibacteraceae bacterium]
MVLSMTGFGKTTCEVGSKKITIEIKSLNSKQLDLFSRVPNAYKEKELELRNIVSQRLERGKIEFGIYVESINGETATQINEALLENYYTQIKSMSTRLGVAEPADWMPLLLRMPDVMKTEIQEVDEEDWQQVKAAFEKAVQALVEFRTREGESLAAVFEEKIGNIRALLSTIDPFEKERVEKIKQRIMDNLSEIKSVEYDKNRFEQEMIYYIEKLDVNEEKNRLRQHLTYFEETMKAEGNAGKKLGFIAQEIGREINTLGSKSNHSEMQKIVVKMKDELEQIKEQVLNVL